MARCLVIWSVVFMVMEGSPQQGRDNTPNGPCQKLACAIQDCLVQHSYQQSPCAAAIEAYATCMDVHERGRRKKLKQAIKKEP